MEYFSETKPLKFDSLLKDHQKILAHTDSDGRDESLKEHSDLCIFYLDKLIKNKNLDKILKNLENRLLTNVSDLGKKLYRDMMYHTIMLHDIGKINCNYQYRKLKNQEFKGKKGLDTNKTNHSMLSALIYINEYIYKIEIHPLEEEIPILCVFMLYNAYVISKHHGSFDSFKAFKEKVVDLDGEGRKLYTEEIRMYNETYEKGILSRYEKTFLADLFCIVEDTVKKLEEQNKEISFGLYIYVRLLASLLLSCDYYATSHFKNKKEIDRLGLITNIKKIYQIYENTHIYNNIRKYEKEEYTYSKDFSKIKDINILRNEMFLDAEQTLLKNIEKNIFYLEAPTGSGKSNTAFNLTFQIIKQLPEINKIFYVYPFNTLIEQNLDTLANIFNNSDVFHDITVINSLIPIKTMKKLDELEGCADINDSQNDYVRSLLDRQFLHYPIILTTHVSLFNYLFGTSKDHLFPLAQLANSVIILDEIQSYKNSIWKEMITFLKYYSELLNIKFIIMSATLPNLSKLIDTEIQAISLIEDRDKYFKNPIFKNRVKLDFSLLKNTEDVLERLLTHVIHKAVKENINILIEFISKARAMEFYEKMLAGKEQGETLFNKEIRLLTGDDNSIERKKLVDEFKENKNIILIGTQVIEAGVDIDADIGYKDISLLDSEEQFLGRVNRSYKNKNGGTAYFFNLDSAGGIYKNDVRKEHQFTLLNEIIKDILVNKDFKSYYNHILDFLNNIAECKSYDEDFTMFVEEINKGNYEKIKLRMNLIDENFQYRVFLSRIIEFEGEIIDGAEVWENYISLLENNQLEYAEKKVRLSEVAAKMNHFIYQVRNNNFYYEKNIGDLYYISEGQQYFKDGKFMRDVFENNLFL